MGSFRTIILAAKTLPQIEAHTSMTDTQTGSHRVAAAVLTAAYYASLLILGLETGAEGPSLPTLARHTFSGLDRISLIFITGSIGYLLGSLIGGRIYDRLPGHRVMATSLLVMLVTAVVYPLAAALWILLAAAFIMGLGKGALDVGCNTLLQWQRGDNAGPYLNGLHFAFGLGSFFSPILLAQIILRTQDIYWVFWTIAIVMLPVMLWLWVLPSPHPAAHTSNGNGARVPLVPVVLIMLALFLYVGAEIGFSSWLYTYAITLQLADAVQAAYLTSGFWALFTFGRLLGIWIATRFGSRPILFFDLAGCLLSLVLIWVAPHSLPVLWAGSMGLGFSMASIFPTVLILAGERLRVSGTVTGWFLLGSGAGGMLLPWLIGNALGSVGPLAMIALIFIDVVLNLLVLLLFMYGTPAPEQPVSSPS